jgi:peptide/nickel transport system substrate-binding protein
MHICVGGKKMKKKKAVWVAIFSLLLGTLIVSPLLSSSVVAQEKTIFVMAYPSDIGEMNPLFIRSERTHWFLIQIYDTLIAYDTNLNPIPWLAKSWEISDDAKNFTFHIRENVRWHDGEPLTADDVAFTFNYMKAGPPDVMSWSVLQKIVSCEAIDTYTVKVVFNESMGFGLSQLGDLEIIPKHIWDGVAHDDARWDDPDNVTAHIGSGPFVFKERVPDEYILLEKNENWWGKEPNIDGIRIDVIIGQAARILAMREGTADTERYELWGTDVNTVIEAPELKVITGVVSQWDYVLGFNLTIPGLDDVRVRKAISYALDRERIITVARLGWGTATWSVIPESYFPTYYNETGRFPEQNVTYANQILDAAGYNDTDGDGIREFPGDPNKELAFDMMVLSWDIISVDAGAAIAEQLREIGISVSVEITDDAIMYPAIYELPRNYRMYEMSHGFGSVPDHVWFRMHSANDIDWGDNCYGLHNDTMDAALDGMLHATSDAERIAKAKEVQELAVEIVPYIPLFLSDDTHAIRKEWVNYTLVPGGPFTSHNRLTMLNIYSEEAPPPAPVPAPGIDWTLIGGVGVVCLVVGVVAGYLITRKKQPRAT